MKSIKAQIPIHRGIVENALRSNPTLSVLSKNAKPLSSLCNCTILITDLMPSGKYPESQKFGGRMRLFIDLVRAT